MTAREALDAAKAAESGERLRRHASRCAPRGGCRSEPLEGDLSRWTWCPDCLTLFDYYGKPVNELTPRSQTP
jgi:hypothetical protein